MHQYYVNDNAQPSGEHEVHTTGCVWLEKIKNKTYLGLHQNCSTAVQAAARHYSNVDGCATCCSACHKK